MNAFSSSMAQKTRSAAGTSSTNFNRKNRIIAMENLAIQQGIVEIRVLWTEEGGKLSMGTI